MRSHVSSHYLSCGRRYLALTALIVLGVLLAAPGMSARAQAPLPMIVNEVDYDHPGDNAEFIELYNPNGISVNIDAYVVELAGFDPAVVYRTFDLPNVTVGAYDYYVICGNAANTPNCDLDVTPDTYMIGDSSPGAVALRLSGVLVDTVSYEGNTGAPYTETSGVGLVDTGGVAYQGISRFPDAVDTNVNNVDFSPRCITPGMANIAASTGCLAPGTIPLVINEVDYNQSGTDTAEFIELYNPMNASVNIDSYSVVLVNGNGGGASIYRTIELPNVNVGAYGYYVICANAANVVNCNLDVSGINSEMIENGSPDAVGLRLSGVLVDTVSYEGNTGAPYTETSGVGLEDSSTVGYRGISRHPNGTDTNVNNVDFSPRCITPGRPNGAASSGCGAPSPTPVINEFVANHTGTDNYEYVEIYGNISTDYSNFWVLQIEGDNAGGGGNQRGRISSVHRVGTTSTLGYWTTGYLNGVLGDGTMTLLLVTNFTGAVGNDIDWNNDGGIDHTYWSAIADGIAVTDNGSGDRTYNVTLPVGFGGFAGMVGGASRIPNGKDTNNTSDWMRNDFDGAGIPALDPGTPVVGEALNTPGAENVPYTFVNQPPVITSVTNNGPINEGQSATITVAATDPNAGDTLTYSFDCDGDGTYEVGPQAGNSTTCAFGDDGAFIVNVQVQDNHGASDTDSTVVTVNNVAPTITSVTNSGPIDEGQSATITVTATDPAGANDPLTYSFDCDDNGTYEVGPQAGNSTTCAFGDNGSFTVNVLVEDGDGGSDTDSTVVTVNNVAPTITGVTNSGPIDEGQSATITVTATDPAGANDPLAYSFDCDDNGTYEVGPQAGNGTTCFFGDSGTYTVNVLVEDGDGGSDTDSTVVTVNNVAPTADAGPDDVVARNDIVNLSGTWTDPAGALDEPYDWSWDLDGDGTPDSTGSAAYGTSADETTSFATEGIYILTFEVTDKDGGTGTDTVQIEVLNEAPVCDGAYPSVAQIWPPDGTMVPIGVLGVTDAENDPLAFTIHSIFQDEPVGFPADATFPDGEIPGDGSFLVRAQRMNGGDGRVYHIAFTADDGHGGSCSGEVAVEVPLTSALNPAGDGGALYNSLYDVPQPFDLIEPANGSTTGSTSPVFSWYQSTWAEEYKLVIKDNKDVVVFKAKFAAADICAGGICTVDLAAEGVTLKSGKTYTWKVKAINELGKEKSAKWTFTTP